MLSLQPPHPSSSSSSRNLTPHLLPCRIHHSGPIAASPRHWNPQPARDTAHADKHVEATFRGRALRGRRVAVPEGYAGVVVQKTGEMVKEGEARRGRGESEEEEEEEDEDEEGQEVQVLERVGEFDEVVVWGHGGVPGEGDVYMRGLEEWIGFAETMHSYDTPAEVEKKTS